MPIYDISLTISNDLPTWPGDPALHIERVRDIHADDGVTLTRIDCCVHLGTHLDAPVHFVKGGRGVDTLDLNTLLGPCHVAHLPAVEAIDAAALEQANIPLGTKRLLIRTRNSEYWARGDNTFHTDFVPIASSGAEWLVQHGVRLVGVDYLSIGSFDDGVPTHEILLRNDVVPVEGLNLSDIEAGEYQLICLPLKLKDCDGAPARAVLMRDE